MPGSLPFAVFISCLLCNAASNITVYAFDFDARRSETAMIRPIMGGAGCRPIDSTLRVDPCSQAGSESQVHHVLKKRQCHLSKHHLMILRVIPLSSRRNPVWQPLPISPGDFHLQRGKEIWGFAAYAFLFFPNFRWRSPGF